jgi:cardiolipin synthase
MMQYKLVSSKGKLLQDQSLISNPKFRQPKVAYSNFSERLRLIKGGKEYFDLLIELISKAENSIHFQTYIFDEDETGTMVAEALKAAARRHVVVSLLVDGYASKNLSKNFITGMTDAGIKFKMFDPLLKSKYFYLGRRLHHKVVTIDSKFSLVAGLNISNRYNDLPGQPAWYDCAVYEEGQVSEELTKICELRMQPMSINRLVKGSRLSVAKNQVGSVKVNVNDWVRGKRDITKSYIDMFRKAKNSITILSAYFLPNDQFRKRMKSAVKRGVKVQVILAGTSDIKIAKYAERYMYRWLLTNGIEIFEYQKSILHGKMAAYDGEWATVGSYNINTVSAFASIELNLGVTDRVFVKQVEQSLHEIMQKDCLRITSQDLKASGFMTEMAQRSSYYLYRVMFFLFTFYFKQHE